MKTHNLKCIKPYWRLVHDGIKTMEYRLNDRDYMPGDTLVLHEIGDAGIATGRKLSCTVTHILQDNNPIKPLPLGWCIMSITNIKVI